MTIIAAILLFGLIVFIHELGHFLFAKRAGVTIHEFSIGMGPKLFSKKKDEIMYSVRALPLGGYVSMEGEDGENHNPNSFGNKTILQRASILFAGPMFNIILTIILFAMVFMYVGIPSNSNILGEIVPNSPALRAGLRENDRIIKIDGKNTNSWEEIVKNIRNTDGKEIKLEIKRDGKNENINLKPIENEQGNYVIGITQTREKSIIKSISAAFMQTINMAKQIFIFFGQLITNSIPGGFENAVAGPVGVIGVVSDAAKMGIPTLINIGAMISLNLGIFNLLPIPALDGGKLFLLFIEAIRGGKKLDPNKEAILNMAGFMLLMGFMVFVTYKDITKLF